MVYYVFDLLNIEGTDLRSRPLIERGKLLAKVLKKASDNMRFSEELQGTKEELLQLAQRFGLEGLIAKKPDSLYEPGRRSGAWVKVKLTQQQEFVIDGYTPPEGSRLYFGSLLVGYIYAGERCRWGRLQLDLSGYSPEYFNSIGCRRSRSDLVESFDAIDYHRDHPTQREDPHSHEAQSAKIFI